MQDLSNHATCSVKHMLALSFSRENLQTIVNCREKHANYTVKHILFNPRRVTDLCWRWHTLHTKHYG